MNNQRVLCLALVALLALPALAWTPSSCPEEYAFSWAKYEAQVRKAEPGSTLYIPHPFPTTEDEIVANLKHAYLRSWSDTLWANLPEEDKPLFLALERGTLDFEVAKVIDWGLSSCIPEMPRRFTWLVRVFDENKTEISRFSLNESGFIGRYVMLGPNDDPERHAYSMTKLHADIERKYGLVPRDGQLLSTWGTLRCAKHDPCFAFRANDKTYVLHPYRGLYSFDSTSLRHDLETMEALRKNQAQPRLYITGGHDLFIEVTPVASKH